MGRLQARRRGARKSIEGLRRAARPKEETFRDEEEDAQVRAQVPDGTAHVAGPTSFREAAISYSEELCCARKQRSLKYSSKKIDISETRLLRPETTRVTGHKSVAVEICKR